MAGRAPRLRHAVDALRFAIDFAQTDLGERSDAKAWTVALEQFIQAPLGTRTGLHATVVDPRRILSRDALQALQRDTRSLLHELIDRRLASVPTLHIHCVLDGSRGRCTLHTSGRTTRDGFLFRLLRLIEALDAVDKLLLCPEPTCGRIFLKVTNKEHCSTRCQSRAYMRQWRASHSTKKGRHSDVKTTRKR